MAFIKSSSPDTLRAYQIDLSQAFQLKISDFPSISELDGGTESTSRRYAPKSLSLSPLPSDLLLMACRRALHNWAHLSPASRNRKAACLKSFLNWLYAESLIDRDLAFQIHSPKVPQRLPHHLSVDEALALLHSLKQVIESSESTKDKSLAERDLALILLLYGGGLRVSEACSLEWRQVDRKGRLLRVTGKGDQERIVALPPMSMAALERLPSGGEPYVFGAAPLSTRVAYEIVRSRGAQAGLLQPLHPHALRHSYATHLLSSGANLRTLQELLGHRSLQATQRYTHIGIDQLARTLESFHPLGTQDESEPNQKPKTKTARR